MYVCANSVNNTDLIRTYNFVYHKYSILVIISQYLNSIVRCRNKELNDHLIIGTYERELDLCFSISLVLTEY